MSKDSEKDKNKKKKMGTLASKTELIIVAVYLISLTVFLIYNLTSLWPTNGATNPTVPENPYLQPLIQVTDEQRILVIVSSVGALGSLIQALRSFYAHVGNETFEKKWISYYILLPFMGSILGTIFYLVIRGGFFSPSATEEDISLFGFAAISGLVGLFSQQAMKKLKQVAGSVFTEIEDEYN